MMKRTSAVFVMVLIASVGAASVARTYRVYVKDTGAQLLWNSDEAFLFVGTKQLGWRFSYLRLLGENALALVQTSTPPQDSKPSTVMFKITSEGVERHVLDNIELLSGFTVFESRVRIGPRWQWTGSQFDRTTPEEERRLAQIMPPPPSSSTNPYGDYSNVNGWSSRHLLPIKSPTGGTKLPFDVGGQPAMLTVFGESFVSIDIDLQRGNDPPERLLSLDERLRSVSKAEYTALFRVP